MNRLLTIFFIIVISTAQLALAQYWNLPQHLTSENTKVSFEVDSTWHLIKGDAKTLEGNVWLSDPKDFSSVKGEIRLPIAAFDTGNHTRDEKLRVVTNSAKNPDVVFMIERFDHGACNPETLLENAPCDAKIYGALQINNIKKQIVLDTRLVKSNREFKISGKTSIKWAEFNIEDPSILVAKLYQDVNIYLTLTFTPKN